MSANVWVKSGRTFNLLTDVPVITGATTGAWLYKDSPTSTIQATVIGTGSVTCTVTIQVSNDGVNPVATSAGVITLSGTTSASDGFTTSAPWKFIRAVVTVPTGTISAITCVMGV